MQASPQARPLSMRIVIRVASSLLLDLDLAVENGELRRLHLERLPRMRVALKVCRDDFVGKGAGGIFLGNDPRRGPEIIGGLPRGMATEARVELLPVRQLDHDALELLVLELLAGLVVDAETPHHLLEMLELVVQHAGWRNARLIAALQAAEEEELGLRLRATAGEPQHGQCDSGNGQALHSDPTLGSCKSDALSMVEDILHLLISLLKSLEIVFS